MLYLILMSVFAVAAMGALVYLHVPELVPRLDQIPYAFRRTIREAFSLRHFAVILWASFLIFLCTRHGHTRHYVAA